MTPAGVARRDRARYLETLRIRAIVRAELATIYPQAPRIAVDNSVDKPPPPWGDIEGGDLTVENGDQPLVKVSRFRNADSVDGGQPADYGALYDRFHRRWGRGPISEAELLRGYGLDPEDLEP